MEETIVSLSLVMTGGRDWGRLMKYHSRIDPNIFTRESDSKG